MKKPTKKLMFAYIMFCLLILVLTISSIASGDWFYFDFSDGFWPFGTGFDLSEFTIEETLIYSLLPIIIYWIWYKLDDFYK